MPSCPVVLVFLLAALLNLTLLSGGSSEPPSESLGLLQVCQRDADSAQGLGNSLLLSLILCLLLVLLQEKRFCV